MTVPCELFHRKLVEVGRHNNIEILTLSEVKEISGPKGNFKVTVTRLPRYVDVDKCIACGLCSEKCPKKVTSEYDAGLAKRKAIYVKYPQAVPLKYAIDDQHCIYLTKGKCRACEKFCPTGAIRFDDRAEDITLNVGAVILATGFDTFDPSGLDTYHYGSHSNVITAMEFERILSASGPTGGHLVRASDKREPKKIAWLQCVGSRDQNRCDNAYCSSVCCMYAIKEAVIAREHSTQDLDCAIFYMDIRAHGKDFESFYNKAQTDGVRFLRSRVHTIDPLVGSDDLSLRYVTESGETVTEIFDMVVLSVGLEISGQAQALARKMGLEMTRGNFADTPTFAPVETTKPGVFVCGAFLGPKDIPQAVIDSSAAAAAAGGLLSSARGTRVSARTVAPETDVSGERPRIGVFICRCGVNIASVVDVPGVVAFAKTLPYVEYVSDNLFSCSQDNQEGMARLIREKGLNRVVVAACTPKTHEALFQETLMDAGLNRYLFEMTNIRNHDAWVHKDNPEAASAKANDLVRMAVAKAALIKPLKEAELEIDQTALVIGGGIAGMAAAKSFALQGYETHLVERNETLGGQALKLYRTVKDENIQKELAALVAEIGRQERIHVHLNAELSAVEGFVGNFDTTVTIAGDSRTIRHGVAVIATGASALVPSEYEYGRDERIITSLDLDRKLVAADPALSKMRAAVFIQCVGSREPGRPYCSRVCCTHSIHNALELKKLNPAMDVYVLYRDIRTYGEREYVFKAAREAGVIFIRYSLSNKPAVTVAERICVTVTDHVLGLPLEIEADLLTLASAIVPNENGQLSRFFKVPLNDSGLFVEKHAKLGPSEFATDGVFLCGMAHYPKPIDESVAQGQAAASRAVTLLARKTIRTSGMVAETDPANCSACGVCLSLCPYSAPAVIEADARLFAGKTRINSVLCKGCGLCAASCRSGAIHLNGFDNDQIFAQIYSVCA